MPLARLALATILAPLAAPVVSILLTTGGSLPLDDSGMALYFGVGAAFAYLGFFLGGVPVLIALRRLQRVNLTALFIAGAVLGVLVFELSLYLLVLSLDSIYEFDWLSVIHGAFAGVAVALCFGLIAGVENLRDETYAV